MTVFLFFEAFRAKKAKKKSLKLENFGVFKIRVVWFFEIELECMQRKKCCQKTRKKSKYTKKVKKRKAARIA
jgi:hypothetical protein